MKNMILALTISFLSTALSAQDKIISYRDFKINGLNFLAEKSDIIKVFGRPQKIFEPKYECGFLSESEQGRKFYSLVYNSVIFTGNAADNYQLDQVDFNNKMNYKITYKGKSIVSKTTKKEFEAVFGIKVNQDVITMSEPKGETTLIFRFKNGVLVQLEYWTPC